MVSFEGLGGFIPWKGVIIKDKVYVLKEFTGLMEWDKEISLGKYR